MANYDTINYSNLNKSLNLKWERLKDITKKVSENIWKVFLETNERKYEKNKSMQNKINKLSDNIENASEWMKANFILTVDYLLKNKLLKTDKIKSLKLRAIEDDSKTNDEKLESILIELKKDLSEANKLKLDQHISQWLLNLSKEADSADKLWEKITNLEQENADLKSELDASDTINQIALESSISRWSTNNISRIWNYIKKLNEDNSISPEKKARKILIAANSYRLWWIWTRFSTKLFRRFDVNKEYSKAVERLSKLADKANDKKKLSIVYVMKQINKAHTKYIEETSINESTKKANVRNIYNKIAA